MNRGGTKVVTRVLLDSLTIIVIILTLPIILSVLAIFKTLRFIVEVFND